MSKLTKEVRSLETDIGAAIAAGDDEVKEVATKDTPEGKEYRELRSSVDFGRYVAAAMGGHGVTNGPELELNQHLNIADGYFPMELLAGDEPEVRAAINGEALGQSRDLARSCLPRDGCGGGLVSASGQWRQASLASLSRPQGAHLSSAGGRRRRRRGRTR